MGIAVLKVVIRGGKLTVLLSHNAFLWLCWQIVINGICDHKTDDGPPLMT